MKYRQKSRKWGWLILVVVGLTGVVTALLSLPRYELGYRFFRQLLTTAPPGGERAEAPGKEPGKESAGVIRNNIYDRNFNPLAVNVPMASLYARPLEFKDNRQVVPELSALLQVDEKNLQASLSAERNFVWLGRHLNLKTAEQVLSREFRGVYMVNESQRLYPYRQLAAHVVGFVNEEEQGLAGIEYSYDHLLRGGAMAGLQRPMVNRQGEPLTIGEGGAHLLLTLDMRMQSLLEKKLLAALAATGGGSGTALLMEPGTGRILSLVNVPSYDPNAFWDYDLELRRNRAITEPIYPGGLQALFRMGAALSAGWQPAAAEAVAPEAPVLAPQQKKTRVAAEEPTGESSWRQLADGLYQAPASGWPAESASDEAGLEKMAALLGFSRKSGIDLPDEGGGSEKGGVAGSGNLLANLQVATTPVHLLTAFARLLNGGLPVVPHLLEAVWDPTRQERIEAGFPPGEAFSPPEHAAAISAILARLTVPGAEAVVLESLVAEANLPLSGGAGPEKNGGPAEMSGAAGGPPPTSPPRPRYHAVLLAAEPVLKPELLLLLVVGGARVEVNQPSPFRTLAVKLLQQALPLARQPMAERPTAEATPEASYDRWQQLQNSSDLPVGQPRTEMADKMPLVIGVSLRKALQTLQSLDLEVKVKGSGRVVKQKPAAGTLLTGIKECTLELQIDQ